MARKHRIENCNAIDRHVPSQWQCVMRDIHPLKIIKMTDIMGVNASFHKHTGE